MSDFLPLYIYFGLTLFLTICVVASSALIRPRPSTPVKYTPYESGIQTETNLFKQRFPLKHYLVGLIFLVFDIEVIFLYPWAVIAKEIGPFAFYEMTFFLIAVLIGFLYVWKKGALQWE